MTCFCIFDLKSAYLTVYYTVGEEVCNHKIFSFILFDFRDDYRRSIDYESTLSPFIYFD